MKVGVMGGTFDPIHFGHLRAAESARDALGLGRVTFVTAAQPPHRPGVATPPLDRYAMVCLATSGNPAFVASDLELRRPGPSYTVDTLKELLREHAGDEVVLIVGSDTFQEMATWKDAETVSSLCSVAVVTRGDDAEARPAPRPLFPAAVRVEDPGLPISATDIRKRLLAGHSIRYLVPDAVADYIQKRGLYQ